MKKLQLKDIVLISLVVSTILVAGYILLPLMQVLPIPAYRALLLAPVYGSGVTLLARKVKKTGVITLMGLLIGGLLAIFFIWMFFIATISGILTDITVLLLFKGYKKDRGISVASGLFPAYQLPLTFVAAAYTLGGVTKQLLTNPLVILIPTIITFLLGYLTSRGLQRVLAGRKFGAT